MDDCISTPMRHRDLLGVLRPALPVQVRESQIPAMAH
jgi:hypothetical protein